jgi:hypothetical protein
MAPLTKPLHTPRSARKSLPQNPFDTKSSFKEKQTLSAFSRRPYVALPLPIVSQHTNVCKVGIPQLLRLRRPPPRSRRSSPNRRPRRLHRRRRVPARPHQPGRWFLLQRRSSSQRRARHGPRPNQAPRAAGRMGPILRSQPRNQRFLIPRGSDPRRRGTDYKAYVRAAKCSAGTGYAHKSYCAKVF